MICSKLCRSRRSTINQLLHRFKANRVLLAVVSSWLALMVLGFWQLHSYSTQAGASGTAPQRLADTRLSDKAPGARLLFFAHPHCPCTKASLVELAIILERVPQDIVTEVHFVRPTGVSAGWERTASWEAAAKLPGVKVLCDEAGELAQQMGAQTSGQAMLYDRQGELLFRGGLTRARGQAGESPGRRAILARLAGAAAPAEAAVYGCPLLNAPAACSPEDGSCQPCR